MSFNQLSNNNLPIVENGNAENISDFFNETIRFQFENVDTIKRIHNALLEFIERNDANFLFVFMVLIEETDTIYKEEDLNLYITITKV